MKPFAALLFVSILAVVATGGPGPETKDKKDRKPKFTISKETTYFDGPIDKDGYIDYPAALNERLGKGVTADNNANVLLWKALGPRPDVGAAKPEEYYKLMGMEKPPENGDYFIDLRPYLRDQLRLETGMASEIEGQRKVTTRYPWAATDHPQVAEWLKANEKPLALVIEATKRPRYFSPLVPYGDAKEPGLVSALLSSSANARVFATALVARAMLRTGEGNPTEAWHDLLACQRLGRHISRGWSSIESTVGYGCDQMAQQAAIALLDRPEVDGRLLAGFRRDMLTLAPMPSVAEKLDTSERLYSLDSAFSITRRTARGADIPDGDSWELDLDAVLRRTNQFYDRLLPVFREEDRSKRAKDLGRIEAEMEARMKNPPGSNGKGALNADATPKETSEAMADIWLKLGIPGRRKFLEAADRNEQGFCNLNIAIALATFQRDQGSYPKTLDTLMPKYLKKIPDDLFTGKPLVYWPTDKGYLLYSFGPNGKDDEGRWYDDEPKGDDPNVRMPVPKPKRK